MTPGPDRILACPACGSLAKVFTLRSGNTFGALFWTDGRMEAPMLPQAPRFTRCAGCAAFYWVGKARPVGEYLPWADEEAPEGWRAAPQVRALSEEELLEALDRGGAGNRAEEIELRRDAWWAGNRAQGPGGGRPTRSPRAVGNMERLCSLLEAREPVERLMKAELARELGRFSEALGLLREEFPKDRRWAAARLAELAAGGETAVRELAPEPPAPPAAPRPAPPPPEPKVPCPHCGKPLRTPRARQCFECGKDWHEPGPPARPAGAP